MYLDSISSSARLKPPVFVTIEIEVGVGHPIHRGPCEVLTDLALHCPSWIERVLVLAPKLLL
jgi:hypothetical protein